jgi:hypothetical protein
MKKYKELIETLLQQNGIGDKDEKDEVLRYALEYERTNNAFATEPELQDYIDQNILNVPQGTPISTGYTNQELQDLFAVAGKKAKDANFTPDEGRKLQTQIANFLKGNKNTALPNDQELDNILIDIMNDRGSSSSSSNQPPIAVGIPQPAQGVPVGQKQDFNALFSASAQLKPKITKIGVEKLERNENFLRDAITAGDQTAITKFSNKLQTIIDIGNKAFIKISNKDIKKLSAEDKKELTKLENAYRASKQNLSEKTTQQDALTDFLDEKDVGYTRPA